MAARIVLLALVLSACQTSTIAQDSPARITNPSVESRAALQQTLDNILHTSVTIAPDALTDSSLLVIQVSPPRNIQKPPAGGRIMEAPIQFQLITNGTDCVLIDQRDRSRHILTDTTCTPE